MFFSIFKCEVFLISQREVMFGNFLFFNVKFSSDIAHLDAARQFLLLLSSSPSTNCLDLTYFKNKMDSDW